MNARPSSLLAFPMFLALAACGGRSEVDSGPSGPALPAAGPGAPADPAPTPTTPSPGRGEHHPRFVGTWVLDEVRALDHWKVYTLREDGTIVPGIERLTGQPDGIAGGPLVWEPEREVRCAIGEHWSSDGPERLYLDGDCDDGGPASIVLRFRAQPGDDADGYTGNGNGADVKLESVRGEPHWEFAAVNGKWLWRKCGLPTHWKDDHACGGR